MKLPPRPNRRTRLKFEPLEDRTTPTSSTVTTLLDVVDSGDGVISLREAIAAAEADSGFDTIDFAADIAGGTINLSQFEDGLDAEGAGPSAFRITTPIAILGSGEVIQRDAEAGDFRLLFVTTSGSLSLENLELSGGLAQGGAGTDGGGGAAGLGGAIFNMGDLHVRNSTLVNNTAVGGGVSGDTGGGGGGGLGADGEAGPDGAGGGPNGGGGGVEGDGQAGGFGGGGGGDSVGEPSTGGGGGFGGGGGGTDGGIGGSGGFGAGGGASLVSGTPGFGVNDAGASRPEAGAGFGGAIFNYGGYTSIVNSTITGNTARGGANPTDNGDTTQSGYGGGLYNLNGYAIIINSTFTANAADSGGSAYNLAHGFAAGVELTGEAVLELYNSIFVDSSGPSAPSASEVHNNEYDRSQQGPGSLAQIYASSPNITNGGGFVNESGSLDDSGVIIATAPVVSGTLANNGGPTRTLALLPGSAAIDAGNNDDAFDPSTESTLEFDQRGDGFPRIANGTVDLGAYERQQVPNGLPATIVLTGPDFVIVQNGPLNGPTINDPFPDFSGESRVAVGDVNRDGTLDYIFSAGDLGGPRVTVISGADGSVLYNFFAFDRDFRGGVFVATGDIDGDGYADIITGAGERGGPHVRVFSGQDGSEIASFFAFDSSHRSGVTVAIGDVNGDGTPDVITGSGPNDGSEVRIFDGSNLGQPFFESFFAYDTGYRDGVYVAAGNLDGDQYADIVAGPLTRGNTTQTAVFSGASLQKISSFFADEPSLFVGLRFALADTDGDGIQEMVVVATTGGGPRKIVVNPLTGEQLSNEFFSDPVSRTGFSVGGGEQPSGRPPA